MWRGDNQHTHLWYRAPTDHNPNGAFPVSLCSKEWICDKSKWKAPMKPVKYTFRSFEQSFESLPSSSPGFPVVQSLFTDDPSLLNYDDVDDTVPLRSLAGGRIHKVKFIVAVPPRPFPLSPYSLAGAQYDGTMARTETRVWSHYSKQVACSIERIRWKSEIKKILTDRRVRVVIISTKEMANKRAGTNLIATSEETQRHWMWKGLTNLRMIQVSFPSFEQEDRNAWIITQSNS